jgi:hypothetical protein
MGPSLKATLTTRNPCKTPCCLGATTPALQAWYHTFTNHAISSGYFIVPYELLQQGHGRHNGFDNNIDLPGSKCTNYFNWQNDIGDVLCKLGMFPKDSAFAQHVESSNNGFTTILALLSDSHPAFVAQPIMLAMNWPIQSEHETVFDFYTKFIDHI